MAQKELIHVRVEKDIKQKATKIAEKFGLTLSDLVQSSLREIVRTKTLKLTLKNQKD